MSLGENGLRRCALCELAIVGNYVWQEEFPRFEDVDGSVPIVERLLAVHELVLRSGLEVVAELMDEMVQDPLPERAAPDECRVVATDDERPSDLAEEDVVVGEHGERLGTKSPELGDLLAEIFLSELVLDPVECAEAVRPVLCADTGLPVGGDLVHDQVRPRVERAVDHAVATHEIDCGRS